MNQKNKKPNKRSLKKSNGKTPEIKEKTEIKAIPKPLLTPSYIDKSNFSDAENRIERIQNQDRVNKIETNKTDAENKEENSNRPPVKNYGVDPYREPIENEDLKMDLNRNNFQKKLS